MADDPKVFKPYRVFNPVSPEYSGITYQDLVKPTVSSDEASTIVETVSSTLTTVTTTFTFGAGAWFQDGTAAAPSISFANDTDTGWYRIGTDNLGAAIGGTLAYDWNASRLFFASAYNVCIGRDSATAAYVNIYNSVSSTKRLIDIVNSDAYQAGEAYYSQVTQRAEDETLGITFFDTYSGYANPFTNSAADGFNGDALNADTSGMISTWDIERGGLSISGFASATPQGAFYAPAVSIEANWGANRSSGASSDRSAIRMNACTVSGSSAVAIANAAYVLEVLNNGTGLLMLTGAGNLGLGTHDPASTSKLHMHNGSGSSLNMRFTNSSSGTETTDGFSIGIDSSPNAFAWVYEAYDFYFGTNNTERIRISSSGTFTHQGAASNGFTINESGAACDTRIEGDTAANLFLVTGSTDRISSTVSDTSTTPIYDFIQSSTGDAGIRVAIGSTNSYVIGVDNSDSDIFKVSYAASGSAVLGTNDRLTLNTSGLFTVVQYMNVGTATDAAAQGDLVAGLTGAARMFYDQSVPTLTFYNSSGTTVNLISSVASTATVWNEQGADIDFRIEGDTITSLFHVDASADRVGFNTSAPARIVDILDASNPQLRLTKTAGSVYADFTAGDTGFAIDGVPSSSGGYSFVFRYLAADIGAFNGVYGQFTGYISGSPYIGQFGVDRFFDTNGCFYIGTTAVGGIVFSGDNSNAHMKVSAAGLITMSSESSLASELLILDQNDTDQPFIDFQGNSAGDATASVSTWTTGNAVQGHVQVEINGTKRWIRFYDDPTS